MNGKKLARKKNKVQKMAALVNLVNHEDEEADDTTSNQLSAHEKMIRDLEAQMDGGGDVGSSSVHKRRAQCTDSDIHQDEVDDEADVKDAYTQLMSKRFKIEQANRTVRLYIDQHFLTHRRQKHLLYHEKAEKLSAPIALQACEVQQFVMYNLFGRKSMYRPKWCSIDYVTAVKQMLVLVVEGVSWLDVTISQPAAWAQTNNLLSDYTMRIISPHLYESSVEEELFMVSLPTAEVANNHRKRTNNKSKVKDKNSEDQDRSGGINVEILIHSEDAFPRTMLVMPFTDMISEGFPVPPHDFSQCIDNGLEGFRFSKKSYSKLTADSPLYAVDCEMVMTDDDRWSLASICVVDEKLQTVYHSLVKPDRHITDYLTKFSGITVEKLKNVTTTLTDVQDALDKLLPSDAILCGQSLNNDLVAMRMYHPYVVDTTECYNLKGMTHSKTGLRRLAALFLEKEIQAGSSGHCAEEDARTTMELVLLKLKIGYEFGNVLADGSTTTPSRFFKPLPTRAELITQNGSCKSVSEEKTECLSADTSANKISQEKTDSPSSNVSDKNTSPEKTHGASTGNSGNLTSHSTQDIHVVQNKESDDSNSSNPSTSVESKTSSSASSWTDCSENDTDGNLESKTVEIQSNDPSVTQLSVFSRRNIPQIEVNMFDLVGQYDENKAVICAKCLSMRRPENKKHVTLYECDKSKDVLKKTSKALKSGVKFVYSKFSLDKKSSDDHSISKKRAQKMDQSVSDLWDRLSEGSLMCVVFSGTARHEGAFMFNVKGPQPARQSEAYYEETYDDQYYDEAWTNQ